MTQQSHFWAYIKTFLKKDTHPRVFIAAVFTVQDMGTTQMSTDRGLDWEDVVYTHSGNPHFNMAIISSEMAGQPCCLVMKPLHCCQEKADVQAPRSVSSIIKTGWDGRLPLCSAGMNVLAPH